MASGLKIVSKIRINGELYLQEELDEEEFRRLVDNKCMETMINNSFELDKTA